MYDSQEIDDAHRGSQEMYARLVMLIYLFIYLFLSSTPIWRGRRFTALFSVAPYGLIICNHQLLQQAYTDQILKLYEKLRQQRNNPSIALEYDELE